MAPGILVLTLSQCLSGYRDYLELAVITCVLKNLWLESCFPDFGPMDHYPVSKISLEIALFVGSFFCSPKDMGGKANPVLI